jgi:hypothetical protein
VFVPAQDPRENIITDDPDQGITSRLDFRGKATKNQVVTPNIAPGLMLVFVLVFV